MASSAPTLALPTFLMAWTSSFIGQSDWRQSMRRKKGSALPLIASALIGLFVGPGLNALSAQQVVLPTAPVELFVPMPPTQFKRDEKINLVYEVHMTNLRPPDLVLISFEVLKDNTSDGPLAIYKDKEIIS